MDYFQAFFIKEGPRGQGFEDSYDFGFLLNIAQPIDPLNPGTLTGKAGITLKAGQKGGLGKRDGFEPVSFPDKPSSLSLLVNFTLLENGSHQ